MVSQPQNPADNIHHVSVVSQGTDAPTHDHDEPAPNSEDYEVSEEPQIENLNKDLDDLKLKEEFIDNAGKKSRKSSLKKER